MTECHCRIGPRELIEVGNDASTIQSNFPTVESDTLADAIAWMAKEIPKSEHVMKKVQAAYCITEAAENSGPMIFARIGTMQAINRHRIRELTSNKTTHWGKRKLKRDE